MVRKVKVVPIEQQAMTEQPEQTMTEAASQPSLTEATNEPINEPINQPSDNESNQSNQSNSSEPAKQPSKTQNKTTTQNKIPCPHCNIMCLAKTLKYSHDKVCKNKPKQEVKEAEPMKVQIVKVKKQNKSVSPVVRAKRPSVKKLVEMQSQNAEQQQPPKTQLTKTETKRAIYESLLTVKF